jgi:hypothetical protein
VKRVIPVCLILVIILQTWVFLVVPTDNNGDPNDYIHIAQNLFSRNPTVSLNRFFGYPLFIKLASLNLRSINLLFFVQSLLFVAAVSYFASSLSLPPMLRGLVYLPALIPSVAYMQKLIFPDGLILSLLLLFMIQILKGRFYSGTALALILTAIKVVFIFLPLLALAAWAVQNSHISPRKAYLLLSSALLFLLPAVFFLRPFPLFMTIVQVPNFVSRRADAVASPTELQISCGGVVKTVTDPAVLASISKLSADEYYMPLGSTVAAQLGCTKEDLRGLQRQLIVYYFSRAPLSQIRKIVTNAFRAAFVFPQTGHVGYMLHQKAELARKFYDERFFYEERQVRSFRDLGLVPPDQPGLALLRLSTHNSPLIRAFSLGIAVLAPLMVWRFWKTRELLRQVSPVLVFIAAYSVLLSWFAFICDRYVYVNYFLWMYLIALWANETFPSLARASLGWRLPFSATTRSE